MLQSLSSSALPQFDRACCSVPTNWPVFIYFAQRLSRYFPLSLFNAIMITKRFSGEFLCKLDWQKLEKPEAFVEKHFVTSRLDQMTCASSRKRASLYCRNCCFLASKKALHSREGGSSLRHPLPYSASYYADQI